MKVTSNYVFFWKDRIANWSKTPIKLGVEMFPTSEHVFMAMKAMHFKDYKMYHAIMSTDSPKEAKDFGRKVKNFNPEVWDTLKFGYMYYACKLKFDQHEKLREELLSLYDHGKRQFVEASPYDTIWGVGLSETDSDILDSRNWKGENLLGQVLTKLAKYYQAEIDYVDNLVD